LRFPNGELGGDRSGGSAKKILLLVQRNRGHARQDVHVGSKVPLGMFLPTESSPELQLFCGLVLLWYCFLLVKSHNNMQQLKIGVLFHRAICTDLQAFSDFSFHFSFFVSIPLLQEKNYESLNFLFFARRFIGFTHEFLYFF